MDEILDNEEGEMTDKKFGGGDFGISEIKGAQDSVVSQGSDAVFTMGQLSRMTTIRRVFEDFDVDITQSTVLDLYEMLREKRDFSDESHVTMWRKTFNPPLQEGQIVTSQRLIKVEDSYGLIEDENCLIFNSDDLPDEEQDSMTISQVLGQMGLLETTELDMFVSMVVEVILKVEGGLTKITSTQHNELTGKDIHMPVVALSSPPKVEEPEVQSVKSPSIIKLSSLDEDDSEEDFGPGSPVNFSISALGMIAA